MVFEQDLLQRAQACCDRFEHRMPRLELRLLRNEADAQIRRAPDRAVVEGVAAGNDFEERRLAAAVAADQRDALAGVEREIGVIEERRIAKGEGRPVQRDERHAASRILLVLVA